jgi:hypothetical protein
MFGATDVRCHRGGTVFREPATAYSGP